MTKKSIALIVAGSLILFGIFLAGAGALSGGVKSIYFDKGGIHAVDERNEKTTVTNELTNFNNIDISMPSGEIELIKSNKNAIEYDLFQAERLVTCDVIDNTFVFKTEGKLMISMLSFKSPYIKLYYDQDTDFGKVILNSASGSVNVDELKADDFSAKSISGSVNIDKLQAKTVYIESTSGSRNLSDVYAEKMTVEGSSGSLNMSNIECEQIELRSVSGSINGDNISCKSITARNTSGHVEMKKLTSDGTEVRGASGSVTLQGKLSGKTYVKNISGSIKIYTSLDKSDYDFSLSSTSGSTRIDDEKFSGSVNNGKDNSIEAQTTSGGIKIFCRS